MPLISEYQTINYSSRISTSHPWVSGSSSFLSSQEWFSINHYPLNTSVDDGGPWSLVRKVDKGTVGYHKSNVFDGNFLCNKWDGYVLQPLPSAKSDAALDAFGTTAISQVSPTNPTYSLSTAVGEFAADGIPMVVGARSIMERAHLARSAGGEYLNVQFGWLPLLRDIRGFAEAVKGSHEIIEQYRKGSDTKIRRGYDGPDNHSYYSNDRDGFATSPGSVTGLSGYSGHLLEHTASHQWFRGAFRYHIPSNETQLGKFREWASMSNHLLGWKVTPDTLWNIAPWSWAADWVTNAGDVMANVSNLGTDGLVMQYGYSMAKSLRDINMFSSYWANGGPTTLSRQIMTEYKQRRPATPYGFGINLTTLTPKQVAIVAALGLSRS